MSLFLPSARSPAGLSRVRQQGLGSNGVWLQRQSEERLLWKIGATQAAGTGPELRLRQADTQLRYVDEIIEKGQVGFEIHVDTKGNCFKGEKKTDKKGEIARGHCKGSVISKRNRIFPTSSHYQGLVHSSYLEDWVGKLRNCREEGLEGEFIWLHSSVSGNS